MGVIMVVNIDFTDSACLILNFQNLKRKCIDRIFEQVTKIHPSEAEIEVYNDRNGVSHWHFYLC